MKIAFIGARGVGATYSGIETYYEEVGSRLAARGHEVTAYCRRGFTPDVPTYRGIKVRLLPCARNKHLETITHSVLSTLDATRRDFDIIQYHAIGSAPLSLLPRLFGHKTIVSVRGLDWQRAKWGAFARGVLKFGEWASSRCPTTTVVVSETLQRHYEKEHGRRPHVIPNAVIPCRPVEPDRIKRFGIEKRRFLLFAGRISPEKGVHTLLEAMRPLADRMPLVVAGGSSYSDDYIRRVRAVAWDGVRFIGNVPHEDMEELLSNCYAYVLPSVMEGLSISLLEAVSYGACIITTAIPENLEVVGDCALTFPVGDATALNEALRSILDDPDRAAELRRKATARAAAQPDWDEVTARTEILYRQILAER